MKLVIVIISFFILTLSVLGQERGAVRVNTEMNEQLYKNVHGLIIGVSEYEEVSSLSWAHNDALLVEKILKQTYNESIGKIFTHTDLQATEFAIISSMLKINKTAQGEDLVVIYLAGHGDVAVGLDGNNEGYFLAHNASSSREYELGGTVSFERINKFINGLTNRGIHVWLITDACRSGKIIDAKGASATLEALLKGYQNTTKFISCQSNELSYEYDSLEHGAFTYFLAKGLAGEADNLEKDGQVSAKELDDYLAINVRNVTNKKQSPTVYSADRFANLMPVNDNLMSYFTQSTEEITNMLASSHKNGRSEGNEPQKKSQQLIAFEDALQSNNLYGSQGSALAILNTFKNKNQEQEEAEYMEELLINKILTRVQEQINIFLSDRPTLGGMQDFNQAINDVNIVLELLEKEHPYHERINRRKKFFEAMLIVSEGDFKNYNTAEEFFLDIEKKEKNAAYVHQGLAMLYMEMNEKDKAEEQLEKAKKKINTWQKPNNTAAHIKILAGELDQALEMIESSSNYDLKGADILFLKTELYTAGNQLQKAEEELKKINQSKGYSKSEFYQLEAKLNELRGRIKVAENFYLKAIEEDKNNASLLAELGDIYMRDSDTTQAIKYFKKALKVNKQNQIALNGLAILEGNDLSRLEESINYYNVNEIKSTFVLLLSRGENKRALKIIDKALNYGRWNAELHFLRGNVHYRLEEYSQAKKSWDTALSLNKHHMHSAKNLIFLSIEEKQKDKAEALIVKYNSNFKHSAEWKTIKYNAYNLIHPNEKRVDLLEEALAIDSTNIEIYEWLYELDLKSSNFNSALNHFLEIRTLGGGKIDSMQFISAVKSQFEKEVNQQNRKAALEGLDVIEKFDESYVVRPLINGTKHYYKGDYKNAMKYLNKFERYYFILSENDKVYHKRYKGYVLLELGFYNEAIDLFRSINSYSRDTEYTGIAMAQYLKGEAEGIWMQNFKKDPKLFKFNNTAGDRYKRMDMNSGYKRFR